MISTDDLTKIYLDLSAEHKSDAILAEIDALWSSESYKAWHADKDNQVHAFRIEGDWKYLTETGFIRDSSLQIRINKIGNRYFLTDAPWLSHRFAAFPYSEESESLISHAYHERLHLWADTIIDMSAGCGHTPLGIQVEADRYVYDINARALAYARLNALINRLPESRVSIAFNDMKKNLPPSLLSLRGRKVLFLFNTPFVPNPSPSSLEAMPISVDGGAVGSDLQVRSFEVVAEFKRRFPEKQVRALFLTWSFGRFHDGFWDLQEQCDKILNAKTKWSFASFLSDEPGNGCDVQENFDYLQDSSWVLRKDPIVAKSFAQLADDQASKGFAQLGYGILSYRGDAMPTVQRRTKLRRVRALNLPLSQTDGGEQPVSNVHI